MLRRKNLLVGGLLALGALFLRKFEAWAKPDIRPQVRISNQVPTLFIHGYNGNRFSFGPLIERFGKYGWGKKTAVIVVNPDGSMKISGDPSLPGGLVQVLFVKNRFPLTKQSDWLYRLTYVLKQNYHLKSLNIVAHSQGGVTVLDYLSEHANDIMLTQVVKVVTLGAPFNDFETGRTTKVLERNAPEILTPLFKKLKKSRWRYQNQIEFLNIAGDKDDGSFSDGQVALSSVLTLANLIDDSVRNYQEYVVKGKKAGHNYLLRNQQVDQVIGNFLFDLK